MKQSFSAFWFAAMFGLFVIWSNSFHAIAWMRRSVSAWDLITLRFAPVGLFCLVWALLSSPRENLRLLRQYRGRFLLMGILTVPVYNLCLNWGQGQVPAGTAALIIAMNSVFTYVIAVLIKQERFQRRKTIGLSVAIVGLVLLLQSQGKSFGAGYNLHALVTLGAPLSWACSTLLGRPVVQRESPLRVTYLSIGIGSAPFLLLAIVQPGIHRWLAGMSTADAVSWVHLWLLCTIVGFAIWFSALKHLPASSVAAFVLLNPPLTMAFVPIWGTETLHATVLGFGTIILAGILVSVWPGRALTPAKIAG